LFYPFFCCGDNFWKITTSRIIGKPVKRLWPRSENVDF